MPRKKKPDRNVRRIHRWKPGQFPGDPDADNPAIEYTTIGKLMEQDAAAAPKPTLWTPGGGPDSGMPCPYCGDMTQIVDSKTPSEILEPYGFTGESVPGEEKLVALGCSKCGRPVMQMRESALPHPKI